MASGDVAATSSADDRSSTIWSLLPSFDPAVDEPREYVEKVRFLKAVCPSKDRSMLGPRLAMLLKGTAWGQVRALDPAKLADPEHGVDLLLRSIAKWDDSQELQVYDRFEKAIYRVVQKSDESAMSFINRLEVAFQDMGQVPMEDVKAFIILRQSCLSTEDKKKILVMTQGALTEQKVSQAMRQLNTKVLTGTAEKKKTYPANYVEEDDDEIHLTQEDEPWDEDSAMQYLLEAGDDDAAMVAEFEDNLIEACQNVPDLANCFSAYSEARGRLRDKLKSRGFWPPRAGGKGKGKFHGKKGAQKGGFVKKRQSLAERIASSHCRLCGARGHWKQECPHRDQGKSAGEINMAEMDVVETDMAEYSEVVDTVPADAEPGQGTPIYLMDALMGGNTLQPSPSRTAGAHIEDEQVKFNLRQVGAWENHAGDRRAQEFVYVTVDMQDMSRRLTLGLDWAFRKRFRPENPEEVLLGTSVGCPAIVDTGASKTVIGRAKVKALVESFPESIRHGIHWRGSKTVFRFGNNETLASVGALYVPLGNLKRWMRIEVVSGNTPFLLSNAFLKAFAADVSTSTQELIFPTYGFRVPLTCNTKGLYLVELAEIVEAMSQRRPSSTMHGGRSHENSSLEVVTHAHDHVAGMPECGAAARVVQESVELSRQSPPWAAVVEKTQDEPVRDLPGDARWNSDAKHSDVHHAPALSGERADGGRGLSGSGPDSHPAATRHLDAGRVGSTGDHQWSSSGSPQLRDQREGPSICAVDHEAQEVDIAVGIVSAKLFAGMRTSEGADPDHSRKDGEGTITGSHGQDDGSSSSVATTRGRATPLMGDGGTDHAAHTRQPGQALPRDGSGQHGGGRQSTADPGASGAGGDLAARAGVGPRGDLGPEVRQTYPISSEVDKLGPRPTFTPSDDSFSLPVKLIETELTQVCLALERQVEELVAWTQAHSSTRHAPRAGGSQKTASKITMLEVYCHPASELTRSIQRIGFGAARFTLEDGDLGTPAGRHKLWDVIHQRQPAEIWMAPECGPWGGFARRNMGRSMTLKQKVEAKREQQRQHLQLCAEVYHHQMEHGRHFHLEQPIGSDALTQPELREVKEGTLRTCFDMCRVGNLRAPNGDLMRKRTVVHTTSRRLRELLDARFCTRDHAHQPIVGQFKGAEGWKSLSKWAERYTSQFATAISRYLKSKSRFREWPVSWDELLADQERPGPEAVSMVGEIVKRRRLVGKQEASRVSASSRDQPRRIGAPRGEESEDLRELFVRLDGQTPRVGVRVLDTSSPIGRQIQTICPGLVVHRIEVCRGTDRFRVPAAGTDLSCLPLRQMWVLHRTSGQVMPQGASELWQRLAKRQQLRKSDPARLSLTVFGQPPAVRDGGTASAVPHALSDGTPDVRPLKRFRGDHSESHSAPAAETADAGDPPVLGHPPRNVARHGPAYLGLGKDDQAWIRRVHHRMGHPDIDKMSRFLRHTHADPRIIAGARDYQCDACVESNRGFQSARPSAIHENIGFNAVVGMDMVSWTNSTGTAYEFLHVIDEGTLFHLGRPCSSEAKQQMACFEDMWLSWAGPPQEVYVDPGSSFASEYWLNAMQEQDIRLKMTATDSHWQLGRTEAHGAVVKRMLSRMDAERAIETPEAFRAALIQAMGAKNTLSRINGYTPEQAVLGIARRLPASVTSCELSEPQVPTRLTKSFRTDWPSAPRPERHSSSRTTATVSEERSLDVPAH